MFNASHHGIPHFSFILFVYILTSLHLDSVTHILGWNHTVLFFGPSTIILCFCYVVLSLEPACRHLLFIPISCTLYTRLLV